MLLLPEGRQLRPWLAPFAMSAPLTWDNECMKILVAVIATALILTGAVLVYDETFGHKQTAEPTIHYAAGIPEGLNQIILTGHQVKIGPPTRKAAVGLGIAQMHVSAAYGQPAFAAKLDSCTWTVEGQTHHLPSCWLLTEQWKGNIEPVIVNAQTGDLMFAPKLAAGKSD